MGSCFSDFSGEIVPPRTLATITPNSLEIITSQTTGATSPHVCENTKTDVRAMSAISACLTEAVNLTPRPTLQTHRCGLATHAYGYPLYHISVVALAADENQSPAQGNAQTPSSPFSSVKNLL